MNNEVSHHIARTRKETDLAEKKVSHSVSVTSVMLILYHVIFFCKQKNPIYHMRDCDMIWDF